MLLVASSERSRQRYDVMISVYVSHHKMQKAGRLLGNQHCRCKCTVLLVRTAVPTSLGLGVPIDRFSKRPVYTCEVQRPCLNHPEMQQPGYRYYFEAGGCSPQVRQESSTRGVNITSRLRNKVPHELLLL